jgi:hypothetical protein
MDNDNYIKIYAFMRKMGLSGVKRDVYALIYGFTKKGKNEWFNGSSSYIAEWTGSKRSVLDALKELTTDGLLVKEDYYKNGAKFCRYRAVVPDGIKSGKCKGCGCNACGKFGGLVAKPEEEKPDQETWFKNFWGKYPRKMGKTLAAKRFKSKIKKESDYNLLMQALDRYNQYVSSSNIQREYIKHGSTWMGEWEDWLENDIGGTDQQFTKSIDERIADMNARQGLGIIDVTPSVNASKFLEPSYG